MARLLSTSGTGVTQSLSIAEDNSVIRNYATEDAIATAIANDELDLGQVVSCTDTLCLYRIIVDPDDETSTTYEKITGGGEGAPLGSITAYEGSTVPAGYLECDGSTFDADRYPALAMLLGSNVLPNIGDPTTKTLGAMENYNLPNNTEVTVDFEGFIITGMRSYNTGSISSVQFYVNGAQISQDGGSYVVGLEVFVAVKPGDVVKRVYSSTYGEVPAYCFKRAYTTTKNMAIKATSSYVSDTENTLFNQIKDYVDQGQSYSTTETLTGGTWIDGKPIYRITLQATSSIAKSTWGLCGLNTQFSNLNIATPVYGISVSSDNICRTINVSKQDGFFCDSSALSSGTYLTIEYTKTTD